MRTTYREKQTSNVERETLEKTAALSDDTMSTTNIRIIAATKINTSIDTGKQNKTGGKKKVRNELFRGQKYATRRREKETTTTLLDEDGRRKQAF